MMLRKIEAFLKERQIAPTRFGRDSVRDPRLVFDMRNGREPGPKMCRRLDAYMSQEQAR